MTDEEVEALLSQFAGKLGELFDHVQIMVTWNEDGFTKAWYKGRGNWYARQGMAHEFIKQNEAQTQAKEIADHMNPPDDSDDWRKSPS